MATEFLSFVSNLVGAVTVPPLPPAADMPGLPIGEMNSLNPAGPAAQEISRLWDILLWVSVAIGVLVVGGLFAALRRARENERELAAEPLEAPKKGEQAVMWLGANVPALILAVVFGFTVRTLNVLAGPPPREDALTLQVVGHQYWWEFRYLRPGETGEAAVITANELQLPVGQRIRVELTASDVIHSFWVPALAGKMDTIPGQTNEFWIQADKEGLYRGICAEFCGTQHANMHFLARAVPANDFEQWLTAQAADAADVDGDDLAVRGRQLFNQRGCAACHNVRGHTTQNLVNNVGPDLTHFASRETIAAGMRPNTRGHLSGWVLNAQGVKPGNLMPPVNLSGEELDAMLAYLEALR
ncbi:MAG: cytochrome c oxidase subunit II [Deinococcus sp.]|nr:cytochrome c oxidase subunit II [Deinococcus sp.]